MLITILVLLVKQTQILYVDKPSFQHLAFLINVMGQLCHMFNYKQSGFKKN